MMPYQLGLESGLGLDWSLVDNRQTFTDKVDTEGLYILIRPMVKPPLMRMYKQVRKLNLKLHLKKIKFKIYTKS